MIRLLPLLMLPIAELWLLLELGDKLGAWPVLMWCVAMVLFGLWLVRRQASALTEFIRKAQGDMRQGQRPAQLDLGSRGVWAFAGIFFAFPGVISDVVGVGLLVVGLVKSARSRSATRGASGPTPRPQTSRSKTSTAEVEVLPPGRVQSPFEKRPRIIDIE